MARAEDGVVLEPRDVDVFGSGGGGDERRRNDPTVSRLGSGKALVVWGEEAALMGAPGGKGESWQVQKVS